MSLPEKKLATGPGKKLYGGRILRFPDNIDTEATYMEFRAYQYLPKGDVHPGYTHSTAFSNVGISETLLNSIYLPSCETSTSEKQNWDSTSGASMIGRIAGALINNEGMGAKVEGVGKAVATSVVQQGAVAAGSVAGAAKGYGVVEQTALKYTGPEQRSFTCTYTLIPRNKEQTTAIHEIVKAFRYHSAPHKSTELEEYVKEKIGTAEIGVRTYKYPSLFRIRWLTNGAKENKYTPKYDQCYCTNVDVKYGDGNFTTFYNSGGAPVTYTITMSFTELEFPSKKRIADGF